jgi:hypothetical protein
MREALGLILSTTKQPEKAKQTTFKKIFSSLKSELRNKEGISCSFLARNTKLRIFLFSHWH